MNEFQILELTVIGVLTGVVGGMLGVGGSLVMIPALTELLGPDQHLYQASAMIVNFFVVVPAVVRHSRVGAIEPQMAVRLIPFALIAVVVGVGISELPLFSGANEPYLRLSFGLFLLAVSVYDLIRAVRARGANGLNAQAADGEDRSGRVAVSGWKCTAVAIPVGLIAGILGVGGGVLAVPLQRRFLKIPIRNAIANSATLIVATSAVGATVKNYAYVTDHGGSLRSLGLALVLIPTAMAGSWFGSKLTHELPLRWIKAAFFVLLVVVALRISIGAINALT